MNYSELIHNYIEGELEPEKEEQLFLALSGNDELRKEFKAQIKIDKAFSQRLSSFVPSGLATTKLFARLGISNQLLIPNVSSTSKKLIQPLSKVIAASLISATLTALLFLFAFKDKIFYNIPSDNKHFVYESFTKGNNDYYLLNNDKLSEYQNKTPSQNFNQIQTKSIQKMQSNDIESNQYSTYHQAITPIIDGYYEDKNTQSLNTLISDADFIKNFSYRKESFQELLPQLLHNISFPRKRTLSGIRLELNSNQYWQIPKPKISESWIPAFHNNGFALSYKISENIRIGTEFRNEHFYQNFSGTDDFGNKFNYIQFPNYQTITLSAAYKFINADLFDGFLQFSAGATVTGAIGRLALGTEFEPSPYYTFTLKLEASMLHYTHQNNQFISPKIGLSYGIGLNL